MKPPFSPGEAVTARGRLWRLRGATAHADCVALDLESARAPEPEDSHVLLLPFDEVRRAAARPAIIVSRRAWWRSLGSRLVSLRAHDALIAPVAADLDLFPYQLEPALAMLADGALRLLLADAVGLGKTVQAGIVVAELFARREADRVLVLVPAGLRDQWAGELRGRFKLDADVIDGCALRAMAAALPRTVNPWMVPRVAIVSMDFAKRPEVRLGLHDVAWDLLIVDEAHTVAADSDRYRAAHLLARQARRVILITATPHDGRDAGFASLSRIGETHAAEALVMFRRSRRDVGLDERRRVHLLRVRLSAAETVAMRTLLGYLRRVWRARAAGAEDGRGQLAAIVLLKRALSSPASLLRSIARRRTLLSTSGAPPPCQLALPLDDDLDQADDEPGDVMGAPGLENVTEELLWLDHVAAAAGRAVLDHRKLRALARLIRRASEPAVVFTEYRDTLLELESALGRGRRCVSLHGGLARDERERVLRAFAEGRADVLLATDTAGTGLNLHHRCRLVVNLELPWSPVRIEQRIGRVDRVGQTRVVHAVHLVGRATPEERILARLANKAERARLALGDADPGWLRGIDEVQTADALLGTGSLADLLADRPPAGPDTTHAGTVAAPGCVQCPDLRPAAALEAHGVHCRRRIRARLDRHGMAPAPPPQAGLFSAPMVTFARARPGRAVPGFQAAPGILAVFDVVTVDARGRLADEALVPVHVACRVRRPASRSQARSLAQQVVASIPGLVEARLSEVVRSRLQRVGGRLEANRNAARARSAAQRDALEADAAACARVQRGLFERRAEREADRRLSRTRDHLAAAASADGPDRGAPGAFALAGPPRLGWVLVVTA